MEISHSSWPWHRSEATALTGYANMMTMMKQEEINAQTTVFAASISNTHVTGWSCTQADCERRD